MNFDNLVTKISNFNNSDKFNHKDINIVLENKVPQLKKPNYRGNQYELDQFNWELQKKEYYSRMRKERLGRVDKETKEIETVDKLQNMLTQDQYAKKWHKLDLFCKKQKFKEYIKILRNEGKIEQEEEKLYLNYLFKMLAKKILTKGAEVDYDIENRKINSIPMLDKKIKALSA